MIDYDRWCERCEHRELSMSDGIICSLTKKKPDFDGECENFVLDAKKKNTKVSSVKQRSAIVLLIKAILGMVLALFFGFMGFAIYGERNVPWLVALFFVGIGFGAGKWALAQFLDYREQSTRYSS